MKKIIFLLLFLFPLFSFSQTINRDSAWIVTHYTKIEKQIPMRDSAKLFTAVYLPNDTSVTHPILMMRTPYSCAPYGENKFAERYWTRGDSAYMYRGYILVMQDVRGRFMSEGTFEDIRPIVNEKNDRNEVNEATDAYDAIEWLVKNIPNNNGKVGVYGISYPGFYATMAALSNHPALKAVSPQAPVTDWFMGDDFHHNGVCFIMDAFGFYREFGIPRPQPVKDWAHLPEITSNDNYNYFLQNGTFAQIKNRYFRDTIKFWNDVAAHPDYDNWWKARDVRRSCTDIKPAILITGGLFDAEDCYGAWNLYKAIKKQSPKTACRIIEGPWFHGGWARSKGTHLGNISFAGDDPEQSRTSEYYWKNFELPFFEYYLKGQGSVEQVAPANVFITGENKWNQFLAWPPATTVTNFYLFEKGNLTRKKSTAKENFDAYTSDPMKPVPYAEDVHFKRTREYMTDDQRFASRRPDVLTYISEILKEDVTVTGPVTANLFVSISTTDADFVVKLVDVFPGDFKYPESENISYPMGGYEMLVRGEIMRGRYRNSFSAPEAFVPDQVTEVKFELPDVAHTFKKGHRIMIQVQSTWYPLADRNPQQFVNPYTCGPKDLVKSNIRIYHDAQHASNVVLPVLKK
ncbi:MAG TPA: CocE/NonD family hydrolase [Bacteroidia bacterium]|nr:CocE/NonD family hydrolase [Bacteroidia bacterium]